MFFKHLLVMCHWSLAWRTPSGPEIKKQDLTFFVLDIALSVLKDFVNRADVAHSITNTPLGADAYPSVSHVSNCSFNFCIEVLCKICLVCSKLTSDLERTLCFLILTLHQNVDILGCP